MLEDAAAMGAGKSDIMDKLQLRADNARAFEARAAPCLAAVEAAATTSMAVGTDTDSRAAAPAAAAGAASEAAAASNTAAMTDGSAAAEPVDSLDPGSAAAQVQPAKISLAELESLVEEGQAIGIKLDSLTDLTRLLNTARAWTVQSEYCLTGKEPHTGKHKRHHQPPSLGKVTHLVEELHYIPVGLPQAESLCSRQQQALGWVHQAKSILQEGDLGQHLPDVQAIVDQGAAFGLEMPELTQLDALVKAIEWNSRVKQALRLSSILTQSASSQQQPAQSSGALALDVAQQDEQQAAPALQQAEEVIPVDKNKLNPPPAGPSADTSRVSSADELNIPVAERLTLSEAEVLVEQGRELPVETAVLQRLLKLTESGQQWEAQASIHWSFA